jgi:hypothetical protein
VDVPEGFRVAVSASPATTSATANALESAATLTHAARPDASTAYAVAFLPPVTLFCTLPDTYPADSAPKCVMACAWLTQLQVRSCGRLAVSTMAAEDAWRRWSVSWSG